MQAGAGRRASSIAFCLMSLATNSLVRSCAWIGAAGVLCSGCFSYVGAELGAVPPGEQVRVHLAGEGVAADLAAMSNQSALWLDGTLIGDDSDQLILRVPITEQTAGIGTTTLGQDVTIPASSIIQLERREFNRARTWLSVGGGVVALAATIVSFGERVPNPELPPNEDDPAGFTGVRQGISLLSIRIR